MVNKQVIDMDEDQLKKLLGNANAYNTSMGGNENELAKWLPTAGGLAAGLLAAPFTGGMSLLGAGLLTAGAGAAGSALGKFGQNAIEGKDDLTEGLLGEAALGSLGGAGKLFGGAKALATGKGLISNAAATAGKPGLLSRFGSMLENKGGGLAASQANLTRAEARSLGQPIADTFSNLQRRTGTANIDQLSKLADSVTGGGGSVTLGINKAVEPLGIDIGDLSSVANKSLANNAPAIFGAQRKALEENVKNSVVKAYGGAEGSLSSVVGGKAALDTSKSFATQAANYRNAFKRSGNVADDQTAKVYQELAGTINDRLYSNTAARDQFLTVGKPQILADFRSAAKDALRLGNKGDAKAYTKLADEFQKNVTNIKDARTFQRDFVELGRISEKTAEAAKGAAAQLGDNVQGLGRYVQKPTNLVALPLEAATPKVSSIMMDIGRKLQGTGGAAASGGGGVMRRELLKQLLAQGVPRAMLGAYASPASAASLNEPVDPAVVETMAADPTAIDEATAMQAAAQLGGGNAAAGGEAGSPRISKDAIDEAVLMAAMSGDKDQLAMMKSLAEYFYPAQGGKQSAATQKSMVSLGQAENIINSLSQQLEGAGLQDNGVLARIFGGARGVAGKVGLDPQASVYESQRQGTVAQLAKALGDSGTLTDQDIQRAMNLVPDLGKSKEEAQAMIAQLMGLINSNRNTVMAGGSAQPSLAPVFGGGY